MFSISIMAQARADSLTASISPPDTVWIVAPSPAELAYAEILIKTNQQLSLWWNPYGVMIGALGVLFAVVAILAVVLIWRQGRGYRKILDQAIHDYQNVLGHLNKERMDAAMSEIDAQKTNLEQQALIARNENSSEAKVKLEELEAKISGFEKLRKAIENQKREIKPAYDFLDPPYGGPFPNRDNLNFGNRITGKLPFFNKCTECGHESLQAY